MKFWLPILNALALSYVAEKLITWAKKRWGLQDPPKWALSIVPVTAILYAGYREGFKVLESLGYMALTIILFAAIFLLPYRRHE